MGEDPPTSDAGVDVLVDRDYRAGRRGAASAAVKRRPKGKIATNGLLPILLVSCGCSVSTEGNPTYSITLDEGTATSVTNPEMCNGEISNGGGDLVENGVRYRGKCEGAGVVPKIGKADGMRYLKFSTDPSYRGESRTRTELALTRKWFSFEEPVYIGFKIRIPERVDKTDSFFYLMQFWQCPGASPIAGIRMSRGYSHRVNFMTRGDSRSAGMATYDLSPGIWASFVIKAVVDPTGDRGSFVVWHDPEEEPNVFNGAYGYVRNGTCRDRTEPPQRFRLKFGIYKGNEHRRRYEVDYDDIRIGNSFVAVSPWTNAP